MPEAVNVVEKTPTATMTPGTRYELPPEPKAETAVKSTTEVVPPAEGDPNAQNKAEQAPAGLSETEKPKEEAKQEETPEQAAKRQGRRFERRLDKAYRARAEAEARAKLLEERLDALEKAQAPQTGDREPTLADLDYDPEKYAQAKAEFAKKQAEKDFEKGQREKAQKAYQQQLVSSWEERVEKSSDKYDDWDDKVGSLQPSVPFVAAIMEAENGPDIAYYLGSHPKEAERIAKLSPLSQVREIGRLEVKLSAESEKPKTPSKAPAPITPLTGSAPVSTDVPTEADDTAAWIRKRQKQVHGKR